METNKDLINFGYEDNLIRTKIINEKIWIHAGDVCKVLELENVSQKVQALKEKEKDKLYLLDVTGRNREQWFISESGFYKLTLTSTTEPAEKFKDFITEEVLTSLRKNGKYEMRQAERSEDERKLDYMKKLYDFHKEVGMDDRDKLFWEDRIRDQSLKLIEGSKNPIVPDVVSYPLSDFVLQQGYKMDLKQLKQFGKMVAKVYREKRDKEPIKRRQHVDGATREVNNYTSDDLFIIRIAYKRYKGEKDYDEDEFY